MKRNYYLAFQFSEQIVDANVLIHSNEKKKSCDLVS